MSIGGIRVDLIAQDLVETMVSIANSLERIANALEEPDTEEEEPE